MKKIFSIILVLVFLIAFAFYALQSLPGHSTSLTDKSVAYRNPDTLLFTIRNTYPHDTSSFTQGLVIYKGRIFEGTGEYGRSRLMEVNLTDGKMIREVKLDKQYFGEGITVLHDTVYQLTWQNKLVFVYTLSDFKKIREFKIATEGWGITTDGCELIVSDGSSNLYYYRPTDLRLMRTQEVTDGGTPAYNLNELEYIDGYIYANQWQLPYIYKIDAGSGQVVAKVNLSDAWTRIKGKDPQADVPNGIAFDAENKKIYITGKLWPELYEIQFK